MPRRALQRQPQLPTPQRQRSPRILPRVDRIVAGHSASAIIHEGAVVCRRRPNSTRGIRMPVCGHTWAMLIKRVYETDPLACPQCGGQMKVIAFIEPPQGAVVEKILRGHQSVAMVGGLWNPSTPRAPPAVDWGLSDVVPSPFGRGARGEDSDDFSDSAFRRVRRVDLRGHRHVRGHLLKNTGTRRPVDGARVAWDFPWSYCPIGGFPAPEAPATLPTAAKGVRGAGRPWPTCPPHPLYSLPSHGRIRPVGGKSNFLSVSGLAGSELSKLLEMTGRFRSLGRLVIRRLDMPK